MCDANYSNDGFVKLKVNQWHKRSTEKETRLNQSKGNVIIPAHMTSGPFNNLTKQEKEMGYLRC